jgi:hypothetical protein
VDLTDDPTTLQPPVRIVTADVIYTEQVQVVDERWLIRRITDAIGFALHWCFGLASMIAILAVLATVPLLQFLSLGYLLECSGRVARSGRLRDGFVGLNKAARIGSIWLGTWLCLWPARFVASLAYDAHLASPDSPQSRAWRFAALIVTVLTVVHIVSAWMRGGKLRHFLWPAPIKFLKRIYRGRVYSDARDATWDFVASLRLPHYFWLGLRGFAGGVAWLFLPLLLFAAATLLPEGPGPVLLSLLGGLLLAIVLLYMPFLQAHFAAEQRFVALFEISAVRAQFKRAPLAFWFALLITLLFALPLYLLKIELVQREVAWIPSLVFVLFIFPARLLAGWAVGRARKREQVRFFLVRWLAWLGELPVVVTYVFLIYFTQYLSWYGVWSLFEQHAFLLPVPFVGI